MTTPAFTCAKCGNNIPFPTPHVAVQFIYPAATSPEPIRHFCAECSLDPQCAVLFSDLLLNNVKEVRIRNWWG